MISLPKSRAVVALVLALFAAGPARAALPEQVDEVLWWLPADTQTVIVAQAENKIGVPPGDPSAADTGLVRAIRNVTATVLSPVREGAFVKPMLGKTVTLAVEGSRRFRAPKDNGMMPYQGAQVLIFREALGTIMATMENAGAKPETIAGNRVIAVEETMGGTPWTFLIARPRPNVLIIATDRGYLKELLERMETKARTRALPDDLPEWAQLDATKPIWAIRHYDPDDAPNDPSSPLGIADREANRPDDKAVGLVFTLDPGKEAKVKYLTGNKQALAIVTRSWVHPEDNFKPTVRAGAKGVVEISVALKGPEARDDAEAFLFLLFAALGHAIYL